MTTLEKSPRKRDSNPGSSAFEADALPLGQWGGRSQADRLAYIWHHNCSSDTTTGLLTPQLVFWHHNWSSDTTGLLTQPVFRHHNRSWHHNWSSDTTTGLLTPQLVFWHHYRSSDTTTGLLTRQLVFWHQNRSSDTTTGLQLSVAYSWMAVKLFQHGQTRAAHLWSQERKSGEIEWSTFHPREVQNNVWSGAGITQSLCVGFAALCDAASWVRSYSELLVEGIFFPCSKHGLWLQSPKTFSDESINRGLVCAHMHSIAWTLKILTVMS